VSAWESLSRRVERIGGETYSKLRYAPNRAGYELFATIAVGYRKVAPERSEDIRFTALLESNGDPKTEKLVDGLDLELRQVGSNVARITALRQSDKGPSYVMQADLRH
jgi:hypothetical protein